MNALRGMWSNTTMVVLTALSAALYAALLIPFKFMVILPGVTEIRPANAIPIVCSLCFGPAGAWGSAFGNLIGDLFFGFGPGSLFGMAGNFLFGFVPYAFWRAWFGSELPQKGNWRHWVALIVICLVSSAACAFFIGWGIDVVIQGVPFAIFAPIIFFNNALMSIALAPGLLFLLLPRVRRWGLLYTQVLSEEATRRPRFAWLGVVLMTVGSVGGLGGGLAIATGWYQQPVGVPQIVQIAPKKIMQPAGPPVSAKRPGASSTMMAASKPDPAGGAKPATASPPEAGERSSTREDPRAKTRKALALGMAPALGLVVLGALLL